MRRFNLEEFLWLLLLMLLDLGIIYLVYNNKIEFYIGQKMVKYMYVSILSLIIITVFQISNVFTPKGSIELKIKLIPIMLALVIGAISVNQGNSFRHNQLNNEIINHNEVKCDLNSNKINENTEDKEGNNNEYIKIDENNLNIFESIRLYPEKYKGKTIEIYGFVCKERYLEKNQFIIGRVMMTCCAADSKVVGILAEYDDAEILMENDWINIIGTISYTTINDDEGISKRVPIVNITKLEKNNGNKH